MTLKEFLSQGKPVFKLICGAGNTDISTVLDTIKQYAEAGVRFFDISADLDIVRNVHKLMRELNIKDYFICVSYGTKDDPHIQKAIIDTTRCIRCGVCSFVCPQQAIPTPSNDENYTVQWKKCIGCHRCADACPKKAIEMYNRLRPIEETLPEIIKEGIDAVELHVASGFTSDAEDSWETITSLFDGMCSICIDRSKHSDARLKDVLMKIVSAREPFTTIIQADGFPMSGDTGGYDATLQALATTQIVNRLHLPAFVIISGGTNDTTNTLARSFGLEYHGIAYGSFARQALKHGYNAKDVVRYCGFEEEE